MHLVLQLEIPADARLLPRIRWALEGCMADAGTGEDLRSDVVLAAHEACVNAVCHAFPGPAVGRIRVRVEITDTEVSLQVEDDGVGFDPTDVGRRPAVPDATSGRGLRIMRRVMSGVELESPTATGGTKVLMRRDLTPPPPAPALG